MLNKSEMFKFVNTNVYSSMWVMCNRNYATEFLNFNPNSILLVINSIKIVQKMEH